ncbi:MAG: DUF3465 domain-containing protein [Vulcanimicrobiaceae bacterium]
MNNLSAGFALGHPSEVQFSATVATAPRFFYGSNTHAWHEAFNVRSDGGRGLEVVDNVALAPPVPVEPGDRVVIRGELVPEASRGPLVHWTHHDPSGQHEDGFIALGGRVYA